MIWGYHYFRKPPYKEYRPDHKGPRVFRIRCRRPEILAKDATGISVEVEGGGGYPITGNPYGTSTVGIFLTISMDGWCVFNGKCVGKYISFICMMVWVHCCHCFSFNFSIVFQALIFFMFFFEFMEKIWENGWKPCDVNLDTGPIEFFLAGAAKLRNGFEYDNYEKMLETYNIISKQTLFFSRTYIMKALSSIQSQKITWTKSE